FSTKSRRYSTTLGALRQVRADYRARQERQTRGLPDIDPDTEEGSTLTLAHWTYAGHGHSPGESWLAQTIAEEIRQNRELGRELRAELVTADGTGEW
ncbi:replication initiation protein, partial [Streptomyces sp. ICN441]|uniref:replication initiator n=1 Tax=Streptomyces sp. ICN441 TaxID=2558286 RepID=UPI0011006B1A